MLVMQWEIATADGDDLIIPTKQAGTDANCIVVLPQIVANQMFKRSGVHLLGNLALTREAIFEAATRAWKPARLRIATYEGEPAPRLWLTIEDFIWKKR